jgi:glutathione S-transferase
MMKLWWSSRSPFVRKVMIAAHELGLEDRITLVPAKVHLARADTPVLADNPLGKIPTLITEDAGVFFDSPVICEYLDGLAGGGQLFPRESSERLAALRRQALGDGLMELMILWLVERAKPAERQWPDVLGACRAKFTAVADQLEKEAAALAAGPFRIGHVSLAAALAYADFRFSSEDWRRGRPALAEWVALTAERPSLRATAFVDDVPVAGAPA